MELYTGIVFFLFVLAIVDLMVGVSNDAVNFLNSAIGSKVAPRWIIMAIASVGIMAGVTFSSGMMEVARKGIFHPDQFIMTELLVIFLAVMLTDVILLDLYNTFGLPTSTTVSIVFELLGAAVAVSLLKIYHSTGNFAELTNYINTGKALAIISGILLSIVVAFTAGAIIQFLTRLLFTFDFAKRLGRYGAIWGAMALTTITYFILIKGSKGASFMSEDVVFWIKNNTQLILFLNLVFWAIVLQLLMLFTKTNILKMIVLVGTGALAMAFAANDLVNFIGVPLAGLNSFLLAINGTGDPLNANMQALAGKVQTPTYMLLIAGTIMVVTLWFSKKAKSVTKTEVSLGRQSEDGDERFDSTPLSRAIVRMVLSLSKIMNQIMPGTLKNKISHRFDQSAFKNDSTSKGIPSFDLLRASVNLVVASACISFATSLKLPLSTTYVTFMVAMGSSLSDKAWGRESAVYRVTGVLTVIGGWFFTALMASTVAMTFATLLYIFKLPAVIILGGLAIYVIYRSHLHHKKRETEEKSLEDEDLTVIQSSNEANEKLFERMNKYYRNINDILAQTLTGTIESNRKKLKSVKKEAQNSKKASNKIVSTIFSILQIPEINNDFEPSPRLIGSLNETSRHLCDLTSLCYNHFDNNHKELSDIQQKELLQVKTEITSLISQSIKVIQYRSDDSPSLTEIKDSSLQTTILNLNKQQLKRIKKGGTKTRQSLLYLGILSHCLEISDQIVELMDGIRESRGSGLLPAFVNETPDQLSVIDN